MAARLAPRLHDSHAPERSVVAEVQARAKSLRLVDAHFASKQTRCQKEDAKRERKALCISIFEQCVELTRSEEHPDGISMHAFVRCWGHRWSTGHGYLDRDEKRYPKARSVRKARAVLEDIESGAASDRAEIEHDREAAS